MREIKYIVIHCTATAQTTKVSSILRYWRDTLGWRNPGYHFIVKANGEVESLQPIEKLSNGVRGYNQNSIHISYIGGKDYDDRTRSQKIAIRSLLIALKQTYKDAVIQGHRDFPGVTKLCPQFNAKDEYVGI